MKYKSGKTATKKLVRFYFIIIINHYSQVKIILSDFNVLQTFIVNPEMIPAAHAKERRYLNANVSAADYRDECAA